MNPFQAIMGRFTPAQTQTGQSPSAIPNAGFGGIFGRVQQLANMFQNPQQMVSRVFPDAPAEVSGNPEQLLAWMQQTGKVTPQMIQMAQSMMGRR
jgi:hypothetical protein